MEVETSAPPSGAIAQAQMSFKEDADLTPVTMKVTESLVNNDNKKPAEFIVEQTTTAIYYVTANTE